VATTFAETIAVHQQLKRADPGPILEAARVMTEALSNGGKVLLFGNGGSAADAQHVAAEFVGRFQRERAALAANRFKVVVAERSAQEAWRPNIGRLEWMTYGRVLDESGKPAGGLHVRVFDRDRKYDDLLGDTVTDVQGRFAVTYHQRDFAEVRENLPELYVLVEDEAGQVLYSSRDAVRFRAGRAEYFEIQLGQAPAPEKPKTPPTRSKQTRAKKA